MTAIHTDILLLVPQFFLLGCTCFGLGFGFTRILKIFEASASMNGD
jgi:hypothetical protein